MSFVKRNLENLAGKIFKHQRKLLTAGFPVVLGQGLEEPRIQPRMVFYWHPPLPAAADEVNGGKTAPKRGVRDWVHRVILKKGK